MSKHKAPPTWTEMITAMTWQAILLITIGLALVSLASGVSLMATALRVALALVTLGLIGWLGNWVLLMALAGARARSDLEAGKPPASQEPPAG